MSRKLAPLILCLLISGLSHIAVSQLYPISGQEANNALQPGAPNLITQLNKGGQMPSYSSHEEIYVTLSSSELLYIYLFEVYNNTSMNLLFPRPNIISDFQRNVFIPGQNVSFPPSDVDFTLRAGTTLGSKTLAIVASRTPFNSQQLALFSNLNNVQQGQGSMWAVRFHSFNIVAGSANSPTNLNIAELPSSVHLEINGQRITNGSISLPPGNNHLRVNLAEHPANIGNVNLIPPDDASNIIIEDNGDAAYAMMVIRTSYPSADISINNGQTKGTINPQEEMVVLQLVPGTHSVFAQVPEGNIEQLFNLDAGQTLYYKIDRLTPAPSIPSSTTNVATRFNEDLGKVVFRSPYPQTQIYIDEVDYGFIPNGQPLEISNLKAGSHRLVVMAPGYQAIQSSIDVRAGQTSYYDIRLNQAEASTFNTSNSIGNDPNTTLIVQSINIGATVYLDNVRIGIIAENGQLIIENISPGIHNLQLAADGFAPVLHVINIPAGENAVFEVNLGQQVNRENYINPLGRLGGIQQPIGYTPPSLVIRSNLVGANISVDGVSYGEVNARGELIIPGLGLGEHYIQASAPGYRQVQQYVTIERADASTIAPIRFSSPTTTSRQSISLRQLTQAASLPLERSNPLTQQGVARIYANTNTVIDRKSIAGHISYAIIEIHSSNETDVYFNQAFQARARVQHLNLNPGTYNVVLDPANGQAPEYVTLNVEAGRHYIIQSLF